MLFLVNSNLFLNPGLSGEPINNPGLLANGAGNPLLAGSALVGNLGGLAGLNGLSGLGAGAGGSLISGLAGRGGTNILGKCLSYGKTCAHFGKRVLIWENENKDLPNVVRCPMNKDQPNMIRCPF